MKRKILVGVLIAIIAISGTASIALATGVVSISSSGPPSSLSLNKAQTGLVASDPLNAYESQQQLQSNDSYWSFGGTANSSSLYQFYESANQLHIGIAASSTGEWSGFYAVTPATNASLVHATLTASTGQVSGYYDTGLYMQSSNELVDYLTCIAISTPTGTTWGVVHGYGSSPQSVTITPLWVDTNPDQPLTRDCTMVTNGVGFVRVYVDHNEVYSANSSSLNMPAPYNFFVEEESEYAGTILYGSYQDFYVALNDSVRVTDIPSNAVSVDLVSTTGAVYAKAAVTHGTAILYVGKYDFPLEGYIQVYNSASSLSNASLIASTPLEMVYGGDAYTFGPPPPKTVNLGIQATDETGHGLSGFYATISQGRDVIANGSTPWTFQLNSTQTYTITVYDYGNYIFDHWSDGSTLRVRTLSLSSNTNLVAIYRDVNSAPPSGKTAVTVSVVDSNGTTLTGLSMSVWQDGVLEGISYAPATFDLTTGSSYIIIASDYGGYTFSHWASGGLTIADDYYGITPSGQSDSLTAVYNDTG